jgi:hypothetical protein
MYAKSLQRILTGTFFVSVAGYLIYRYWVYVVAGFVYLIIFFMRIGDTYPPVPVDNRMIGHFKKNEQSFNRLVRISSLSVLENTHWDLYDTDDLSFRYFLENNPLYYYNLLPVWEEKKDLRFLTSVERDKENKHLMKKLKIKSVSGINPVKANSIEFTFFYNGDVVKGFEFIFDRTKENPNRVFIETEDDLNDISRKRRETESAFFKKINENWNLYIVRIKN